MSCKQISYAFYDRMHWIRIRFFFFFQKRNFWMKFIINVRCLIICFVQPKYNKGRRAFSARFKMNSDCYHSHMMGYNIHKKFCISFFWEQCVTIMQFNIQFWKEKNSYLLLYKMFTSYLENCATELRKGGSFTVLFL